MRIPILTYHSMRIHGNDYADNDHVAFAEDLRTLTALGFRVVPAGDVVRWICRDEAPPGHAAKMIAVTFDDGSDFDFHDLPHPAFGVQRSMLNVMLDLRREFGAAAQPTLHATSFVIVSRDARSELDRTCMVGRGWWRDDWWTPALRTGLLSIGNHSFDHNHPTLASPATPGALGTFRGVDNAAAAEAQIARAAAMLHAQAPNDGAALFAYPYGEASDYLVDEYFPRQGERIGIRAAFACGAAPVTAASNRWRLPRYVFAHDWKTPADLHALLRDAAVA